MGGRYCAINSPLGPRWGQKSLDLRSRDFCPHLEPRGDLIAQYRPPMSFRYKNKENNQMLALLALCEDSPHVIGRLTAHGPVMWEGCPCHDVYSSVNQHGWDITGNYFGGVPLELNRDARNIGPCNLNNPSVWIAWALSNTRNSWSKPMISLFTNADSNVIQNTHMFCCWFNLVWLHY